MSIAVAIETHGCKLNRAESDALARALVNAGYRLVPADGRPDIYILNTCTVTHVADAKARRALRAARRRDPNASIIAVGCYARRAPEALASTEGVDLALGSAADEGRVLREVARIAERRGGGTHSPELDILTPFRPEGRTRAFVKVQQGCRYACAYCIVPHVRGGARSLPPGSIAAEVKQRVAEGYREVVLTGTQPGCYGFDLAEGSLPGLIRRLLSETGVERLRVSSLQPQELGAELVALWSDPRLCPHVHLPLQSGSARVLRRMGRPYTLERYMKAVRTLRDSVPDIAITSDVLVGFPGEGEAEFEESLSFCEAVGFSKVHVFPFSLRPGTRAAGMEPKVGPAELSRRVAGMLALSRQMGGRFRRASLGQVRPVLWEQTRKVDGERVWSGLTDNYQRAFTNDDGCLANRITPGELCGEVDGALWARIVQGVTA